MIKYDEHEFDIHDHVPGEQEGKNGNTKSNRSSKKQLTSQKSKLWLADYPSKGKGCNFKSLTGSGQRGG